MQDPSIATERVRPTCVTVLGAGRMGGAMARALLVAGHRVTV